MKFLSRQRSEFRCTSSHNVSSCDLQKRLLFVVNDLSFFISHRLPIAVAAKKAGHIVHVAYGSLGSCGLEGPELKDFQLHYVPIQRGGTNPLLDVISFFLLWRLFWLLRPNLVHLVTLKPVLYGGIAARLARVPAVVSAMAGLGFVFIGDKIKTRILFHFIIRPLFRLAFTHPNQTLICQNLEDFSTLTSVIPQCSFKTKLIRGSGVDLNKCFVSPEPNNIPIVAMASRLLRDKGVFEFIEAAKLLQQRGVIARFWLIGAPDFANPASISGRDIDEIKNNSPVECLGRRGDVLSLYAKSNIVTLPSYREGLPKSLIEAAASGRAIVTTDVPGCRDAIVANVSGLLVPARDSKALADAIEKLINDDELRNAMGKAGRALAEREFAIEKIINMHLDIYNGLLK